MHKVVLTCHRKTYKAKEVFLVFNHLPLKKMNTLVFIQNY